MNDVILRIENFSIETTELKLLKNINMKVKRKSICCIVGNSGSGKSLAAKSILGIFSDNLRVSGNIYFDDEFPLTERKLEKIRGKQIGIVMQNCAGSLNPLLKNEKQLRLVMKNFHKGNERERMREVLEQVDLPERILKQYPHELSGGMKQRLMIAIGIINAPKLLIMDEPTKGMDLILRNRIADMIEKLHKADNMSVLLITHDLELAHKLSDYCYVMDGGEVVEENETPILFKHCESAVLKKLISSEQKMSRFFED